MRAMQHAFMVAVILTLSKAAIPDTSLAQATTPKPATEPNTANKNEKLGSSAMPILGISCHHCYPDFRR